MQPHIYNAIFLTISTSIFILLLTQIIIKATSKGSKLPPGPWKLPLLGNFQILLNRAQNLPHHRYQKLSKVYGPLIHLKLGQVSIIVASSPKYAEQIMKTYDLNFASRPLFPTMDVFSWNGKSISFGPYGDYWRQVKKIAMIELLSTKSVQSFNVIREEESKNLIKTICSDIEENQAVNVSKKVIEMTSNITMRVVMGKTCEDQNRLIEALYEVEELAAGLSLNDLFPSCSWILSLFDQTKGKVKKCHLKIDGILGSIVEEHRRRRNEGKGEEEGSEDFTDVLLRLQKKGNDVQIDDRGINALLLDIFSGGNETTSSILQWAMSELMKNPKTMKMAQQEVREACAGKARVTSSDIKHLNYLKLVIKETLRLHPPVPLLLPRECQNECELMGFKIPAKSRVIVNVWAIGRDPKHWEKAEEFRPERFEGSKVDFKGLNYEFLPFGAGRRMCPGMTFGMATAELCLASLLFGFDWELPLGVDKKGLNMEELYGLATRRKVDLLLCAKVHAGQKPPTQMPNGRAL